MAQQVYVTVHEMRNSYLHYFSICKAAGEEVLVFEVYCMDFEKESGLFIKDTRLPRDGE